MFISNLKDQIQYCVSTECINCKCIINASEIQSCEFLPHKIDELGSEVRYGKMSGKAKKKLWHFKGGVSRGYGAKGRRKRNY